MPSAACPKLSPASRLILLAGAPPRHMVEGATSETPERERELRAQAQLAADTATQIYSPWKARAIESHPPEDSGTIHKSDLQFSKGDIVTVTSKHCTEWWTGAAHGRHGTFPRRSVKLLPPGTHDRQVQQIEREEAKTRVRLQPAAAADPTAAARKARGRGGRKQRGGRKTTTVHLALPPPEEWSRLFRIWDPNGFGEIGALHRLSLEFNSSFAVTRAWWAARPELRSLVRTLWPSFDHAEAFERACRALRLVRVGDDALHSVRDLGLFLKAVSYCEERWDAMEALDRVEERRIDCTGLLPPLSVAYFPGDATTSPRIRIWTFIHTSCCWTQSSVGRCAS